MNYKEGKRHGPAKGYYESGILKKEAKFVDDKREGVARFYYPSGKLQSEETYQNDQVTHRQRYDEAGKPISGKGAAP